MRVRIGVSDSSREIELEIDDVEAFEKSAEAAIGDGTVLWVNDMDDHRVGIPSSKIGYIDISLESRRSPGF